MYILSLDQGTTSSRAIVFDKKGNPTYYNFQNTYSYDYIKKTAKSN